MDRYDLDTHYACTFPAPAASHPVARAQMKGQDGGNLLAVNVQSSLTRLNARQFFAQPALKRAVNGAWQLNVRVELPP